MSRQCYVLNVKEVPRENEPGLTDWVFVEDKEFIWEFHGWGIDYEELEGGSGQFTCAIIEAECGKIALVRGDRIRFLPDRPEENNLAFRTESACDQLTRYGGGVANEKLADVLEALTDVNDDIQHGRSFDLIAEKIGRTKVLLDILKTGL